MTLNASYKAMWKLAMINFIAPQRATKRFRRYMDDDFKLGEPASLGEKLEEFLKEVKAKDGDTDELIKAFEEFKKMMITAISKDEDAEWGMIQELLDEDKELKETFDKIKSKIEKEDKELEKHRKLLHNSGLVDVNGKVYKEVLERINQIIQQIIGSYGKTLDNLQNKELMISRERDVLAQFQFSTDSTKKSELAYNPDKIQSNKKKMKIIMKQLREETTNKLTEKNKKTIDAEFDQLLNIINDSMNLISQEMNDLIQILVNIRKSLNKVYVEHVQKKLFTDEGCPTKAKGKNVKKEIDKIFIEIAEHIKKQAEVDFEALKIIIQKVAKMDK